MESGFDQVAGQGSSNDDVERLLLQTLSLIEAAVSRHRASTTGGSIVELPPDNETVRTTATQLVNRTYQDMVCVVPAGSCSEEGLGIILRTLSQLVAHRVQARMLCTPETTEVEQGLQFLHAVDSQVQIRIADCPLQELVIVDERIALVRANFGTAGRQAFVLRAPAVVRTLHALFTSIWESASPLADYLRVSRRARCKVTREILGVLSAGYKDDVAARRLGLSVRTYRRHVAEIMRDLDAASRFQAGMRAAELGLLPSRLGCPAQPVS